MSDYKLVPVEPTPEMLEAGEYAQYTGCYVSGIYADMLAAAPAVQGEPVTVVTDEMVEAVQRIWETAMRQTLNARIPECGEFGGIAQDAGWLLNALSPAEQQPCPEGVRDGAPYDDPAFSALCREYGIWGTPEAAQCAVFWEAGKRVAEQQPAPDVAQLVEALEAAQKEAVRGINQAHSSAQAAAALGRVSAIVGAALATYRKGGEA